MKKVVNFISGYTDRMALVANGGRTLTKCNWYDILISGIVTLLCGILCLLLTIPIGICNLIDDGKEET